MQWTREFFFGKTGLRRYIAEHASGGSKPTWRYSAKSILIRAEQDQLTSVNDLTPVWLGSFRRLGFPAKRDQDDRKIFGRLLLRLKIWSTTDYDLFERVLNNSASRWQDQPRAASAAIRRARPNPREELCALASVLALGCGLSTGEMQSLLAEGISTAGLLVRPSRLIPFGNGRDQLPKEALDRFCEVDRPTSYLFFSKSPRDHEKPLSRQTLNAAIRALHPKGATITSLRQQHFREDFDRATNLHEVWSHWLNIHNLSDDHIRHLICGRPRQRRAPAIRGFVNEATVFAVPTPYFLAAICASGCVPSSSRLLQSGKRRLSEFRRVLDRYDITIDWPATLFDELKNSAQKAERALRLLYRLAWEHWYNGRRANTHYVGCKGLWSSERDLMARFAITSVRVVDTQGTREWLGPLFEFQRRKQGFTVPLTEEMTGGAWGGKCRACWHSKRTVIDQAILTVIDRGDRIVEGLTAVAEKFGEGLSYQSLRGHAGLNPAVSGRGNTQRSHIARASVASLTRCPRAFVNRLTSLPRLPLILYGLLLATGLEELEFSATWIQKQVGLTVTDHEVSVALNCLAQQDCPLLNTFQKTPSGFLVRR